MRTAGNAYGQPKTAKQIMLTPGSWEAVSDRAASLGCSRSEYFERVVRWVENHWDGQLLRDLSSEGDRDVST